MSAFARAEFSNTYRALGSRFSTPQAPVPVKAPQLIRFNTGLADFLSLSAELADDPLTAQYLAGNRIAARSEPVATVYAGHQFGNWNPQLGDGRALLLGELRGRDGALYEVQLKGSGQTPYSRMGDGRSPLGPVLREYLVSEAMYAFGIPTTRSLAAVSTGERVLRDFLLPGGVLTRVARSHVRIGTVQYFASRGDTDAVRTLADFVIGRHYRDAIAADFADDPYTGLLSAVIHAQARLIAQWMSVGFIHGVMNTDNMLLGGDTVDYGPCAFMDHYRADKVFSSIDAHGRYAYDRQAEIGLWNLHWLAQALLPLMDEDQDQAIEKARGLLEEFQPAYESHYLSLFAAKLGFADADAPVAARVESFLQQLAKYNLDFTLAFRALGDQFGTEPEGVFCFPPEMQAWLDEWRADLARHGVPDAQAQARIRRTNPLFIPRNHRIEQAIEAAVEDGDFTLFQTLADVLQTPFSDQPAQRELAAPPAPQEEVLRTFCGT
ncbi:YdiU family protein [Granulosicoccaceae sp. 1_MG-2023]|nr:YdiU family protein [Granulosicoccaceae sp. 1_MG-2023]